MRIPRLTATLLAALALAGCAANPVTGRSELHMVSEAQEIQLGQQYYPPSRQSQARSEPGSSSSATGSTKIDPSLPGVQTGPVGDSTEVGPRQCSQPRGRYSLSPAEVAPRTGPDERPPRTGPDALSAPI